MAIPESVDAARSTSLNGLLGLSGVYLPVLAVGSIRDLMNKAAIVLTLILDVFQMLTVMSLRQLGAQPGYSKNMSKTVDQLLVLTLQDTLIVRTCSSGSTWDET